MRAQAEQLNCRMRIETVHRVVGDDVAAGARKLRDQPDMAREQRKIEREPLLELRTVFGAHDSRGAQAKDGSLLFQLDGEGNDTRARRRRMAKEWVEHDFVCTRFSRSTC